MAELGRQPRAAARLITKHRERVLFGTDSFPPTHSSTAAGTASWSPTTSTSPTPPEDTAPSQGRWAVSALHLPADVLEALYRTNAQRVLGLI